MKVVVATERTQGDLPGDYTYCVPGELLWLSMVCDRDRCDPDGDAVAAAGSGGSPVIGLRRRARSWREKCRTPSSDWRFARVSATRAGCPKLWAAPRAWRSWSRWPARC